VAGDSRVGAVAACADAASAHVVGVAVYAALANDTTQWIAKENAKVRETLRFPWRSFA
jgi:hypothetical protein